MVCRDASGWRWQAARCSRPAWCRTGPGTDITDLTITPSSVALGANQSVQLHASGRTRTGGVQDVQVHWNATGGTIDSTGRYTADTVVGDFAVTANSWELVPVAGSSFTDKGSGTCH